MYDFHKLGKMSSEEFRQYLKHFLQSYELLPDEESDLNGNSLILKIIDLNVLL